MPPHKRLAAIGPRPLADHEINLLVDLKADGGNLTFESGPHATLINVASLVPRCLRPAVTERYSMMHIFERVEDLRCGQDFHTHVSDILSGRRTDLLKIFTLSDPAVRLFTKGNLYCEDVAREDRKSCRLVLALSKSAVRRLADVGLHPHTYCVVIEEIYLFVFQTGKATAQLRLTVTPESGGPLTAMELLEAQVALGRINGLHWAVTSAPTEGAADPVSLIDLISTAVLGPAVQAAMAPRLSTFAYYRFEEPLPADQLDALAAYSARHYTSDYVFDEGGGWLERVTQFETVRHAFALDGAATVIAPTPESPVLPDFLQHFRASTFKKHYVPLLVLAHHEYRFLVDLANLLANQQIGKNPDDELEDLQRLREKGLHFRLWFRFSQLSHVTMHNAVNQALRRVLGLDRMLSELSGDCADIESYCRTIHENEARLRIHEWELRRYWILAGNGIVILMMTVQAMVKEAIIAFRLSDQAGAWGTIAGLVIGVIGASGAWLFRPPKLAASKSRCSQNQEASWASRTVRRMAELVRRLLALVNRSKA